MAGKAAVLGDTVRIADYLSMGLVARLIPPSRVSEALTAHDKHSQRQRDLPAHAVAYYVIALSLYRGVNTEEVLRVVTEGMQFLGDRSIQRSVGKSGISAARTRLGDAAMAHLAEQSLQPMATPATPGAFYRGLRIVSLDGSTLEVADETKNAIAFGVPGTQQGKTGYPQLRFTALLENGTHTLFGITQGGYNDAEITLAQKTLPHLKPGMLCLADRGFAGYPTWLQAVRTKAHLLWRIPKNRTLPIEKRLTDGSYLSSISPAPATQAKLAHGEGKPLKVRVIEYQLPDIKDAEPIYRLITTLLDPDQAPAEELAQLYHGRWTIETAFAELKTTLKGADIIMRSKTPTLVRQEFWGLLLAHHVIRKLIFEAASTESSPDRISFKATTGLIRRKLPLAGAIPPEGFEQWWQDMVSSVRKLGLPDDKGRSNPRVVKRRTKKYPPRQGDEVLNQRYDWVPKIFK